MFKRPALLQTLAVIAWTITIIGTFTGFDDHRGPYSALDRRIWMCSLAISLLATWAAVYTAAVAKFARSNRKLATAVLERPLNQAGPILRDAAEAVLDTTGPHLAVSQPLDLRAARRKRRGRRVTRR